jgi:D-aminoacyl-tRNA deacylase
MRAVIQRVRNCSVTVAGQTVGKIEKGLLIYLGVAIGDNEGDANFLADKAINLRIFHDDEGKMNLSVKDTSAEILVVSQFTLCADLRRGRRPSFAPAAPPTQAEELYRAFLAILADRGIVPAHGEFGAHMDVAYTNEGPVTFILDSSKDVQ